MQKYSLNIPTFKKKMLIRMVVLIALNAMIMIWGYTRVPAAEQNKYSYIFLGFFCIIVFLMYRKYRQQIAFQQSTYVIIEGDLLKQYTIHNFCTEVDLKEIIGLRRDNFRSYPRLTLLLQEYELSIINAEKIENLQAEVERISGKKVEIRSFDTKKSYLQAFLLFIPFLAALAVYTLGMYNVISLMLPLSLLLAVLNLNLIFCINQFHEKRWEGGIPGATAQRLLFILTITFLYQVYKIFYP